MPKVFDEAGFSGRFYMADLHEPIHVHITKDGKEAKFWVSPIACANSGGLSHRDLRRAEALRRHVKMQVEQASFETEEHRFTLPVIIPDIKSVRAFALTLHTRGEAWSGLFEGWPASYTPEDRTRRPANSRMTFIPAEFFVGQSAVWHVAITWEDGRAQPPVELENRRGVPGKSHIVYLNLT